MQRVTNLSSALIICEQTNVCSGWSCTLLKSKSNTCCRSVPFSSCENSSLNAWKSNMSKNLPGDLVTRYVHRHWWNYYQTTLLRLNQLTQRWLTRYDEWLSRKRILIWHLLSYTAEIAEVQTTCVQVSVSKENKNHLRCNRLKQCKSIILCCTEQQLMWWWWFQRTAIQWMHCVPGTSIQRSTKYSKLQNVQM